MFVHPPVFDIASGVRSSSSEPGGQSSDQGILLAVTVSKSWAACVQGEVKYPTNFTEGWPIAHPGDRED